MNHDQEYEKCYTPLQEYIMIANYHTHTIRCHHAKGTEEEYIERAIEKGIKILGFSDHVPQPYPAGYVSNIRMRMDELPDYTETLLSLREKYRGKIDILIGFEVEYTKEYFDPLIKELRKYPVDYIIQGQHFVPDEVQGFYTGAKTADEDRLKSYVDFTIEGMRTGLFSYLAHPDLINYTGDDATFRHHMRRLVEEAIKLSLPLEINMYGFLDKRNYPCDRFFSMASEMGASFVIGCDAHWPEVIQQPADLPGLTDFLQRNHIDVGDNIVELKPIK